MSEWQREQDDRVDLYRDLAEEERQRCNDYKPEPFTRLPKCLPLPKNTTIE